MCASFLTTEQISLNISSSAEQEGIYKLNIIAWKEDTFSIFALLLSFKRTPMNLTITQSSYGHFIKKTLTPGRTFKDTTSHFMREQWFTVVHDAAYTRHAPRLEKGFNQQETK